MSGCAVYVSATAQPALPPALDKPMRSPKKSELPSKLCACCQRPMVWRKRWARVWDEVKYCSKRCRRSAGKPGDARGAA